MQKLNFTSKKVKTNQKIIMISAKEISKTTLKHYLYIFFLKIYEIFNFYNVFLNIKLFQTANNTTKTI